jgi:hypothetical protein
MSVDVAVPVSTGRRVAYGVNALVAWTGLTVGFVIMVLGLYPSLNTDPTMLGNPAQGVAGRILDYFTYFTIWSNIVVAVVMTMLFLRPARDAFIFRVLRLDSVLMIVVTGIIYNVVLAGAAQLQGLEVVSNAFDHIITPVVTLVVWLVLGPRGWISWRTIGAALIIPIVWLAWALARGAVIGAYPYGFLDVAKYGYGTVFTNVLGVIVFAIVLCVIFWGIDALIRRISATRSPA